MSLLRELQRRNVGRVATAYIVAAWLIVQVADTVLLNFDVPGRVFQVLVIVLAIGFVPTVIMAWLFEWTPEGLKRDDEAEQSPESRLARARRLDRGIIVVLLIAVSYFAVDKFVFSDVTIDEGYYGARSIAVVPFETRSSDAEQQHFVDGVTDEIRHLLGTIRDLRVIADFSSNLLGEGTIDMAEIWNELKIGHLLQGSVRKEGNRVRVSARLVETRTGAQLWADVYERELDDVFRIQDDIAANVLYNLKIELQEALPSSRNVNPEARALVGEVSRIFQERPENTGAMMHELATKALEIDPDYPEAVKWMAYAEAMRGYDGLIPMDEADRLWKTHEVRYVELVPDSGLIEASRAFDFDVEGNLEAAAEQYLLSLEKELTDSEHLRWAGRFAMIIGKNDVAVRLMEHALAIDPLNHQVRRILSQALMHRGAPGDIRRAIDVREQYLESAASGGRSYYSLLLILAGEPERVADVWAGFPDEVSFQLTTYMAMADYSMGRIPDAEARLASMEEKLAQLRDDGTDPEMQDHFRDAVAKVAAWMGDADTAFAYLLQPPPKSSFNLRKEVFNPQWRNIVDDPRWLEYRKALGMPQERLDAIEFDPWLPE